MPGIVTVCIDLSVVEDVKREVERHKPIHLLVNNAAVGHLKKFLDITTEEYDRYGKRGRKREGRVRGVRRDWRTKREIALTI